MLDTKSFRPHQVLGDAQQYNAILQRQKQLSEQSSAAVISNIALQQPVESLSSTDPASVPKDVWAAAQLLGDSKGVRLLRIYEELANQREAAVQQISLNQTRRQQGQQYEPTHSTPAGLAGAAGLALSRRHHAAAADHVPGQTLSRRTVMDTLKEGHDEKVLTKWAAQQALWQQQVQQLAAATGKHPSDVTLNRGDAWRHKLELLAALEVAVPAAAAAAHKVNKAAVAGSGGSGDNRDGSSGDKGSIADGDAANTIAAASGNWMATLRNSNERFVQIGNVFSGLFLSLKTTPSAAAKAGLTTIRTPAPQQPTAPAAAASSSNTITAATTQLSSSSTAGVNSTSGALSPRLRSKHRVSSIMSTVNKSISSTQGATVGGVRVGTPSDFARRRSWSEEPYLKEKLAAGATAVKALASAAPEAGALFVSGNSIESQLLSSLAVRPVGLDQVEARLAVADPALFREYQIAKQVAEAQEAAAAAAAAEKARRDARKAAAEHQGPHLTQDTQQLSMHYSIPVPLSNGSSSGSAAAGASWPVIVGVNDEDGAAASDTVTVSNTGTAAVYYSWVCNGRLRPEAAGSSSSSSRDNTEAGAPESSRDGLVHERDAASSAAESMTAVKESGTGVGVDSCSMFCLPTQKGVILPGEVVKFRFSFKASKPGIFHESWSMFCHPPLEPDGLTRKHRGLPLEVDLRGVAVMVEAGTAATSDGHLLLLQRQQQELEEKLAAKDRDHQVQGVLRVLLETAVQKAQHVAAAKRRDQQQQYNSYHSDPQHAAAAAKWAAANPPALNAGSSSSSSSSSGEVQGPVDQQQEQQQCVYYYSPQAVSRLSAIYSRTRALLQPPAPPTEPKKGAARKSETSSMTMKQQAAAAAAAAVGDADHHHAAEQLPEFWDYSIEGLRAAVALLANPPPAPLPTSAGTTSQTAAAAAAAAATAAAAAATAATWRQQHAILKQQLEAALAAAAVPERAIQMTEAAVRQVVLQLVEGMPAAAEAAKAAVQEGMGSGHSTYRSTRSSTAADGNEHISSAASSNSGSVAAAAVTGGVTHRAKATAAAAAAAAASAVNQEQYRRALQETVWNAVQQQLNGFETVLAQQQSAVAAKLDTAAAVASAAAGGVGDGSAAEGVSSVYPVDDLLWRGFDALRKKQQLGV